MKQKSHLKVLCILFMTVTLVNLTGCAGLSRQEKENLQQIETGAFSTKEKIRQRLEQSPDSVLKESIKILNSILKYADEVKTDPDRFNPGKIEEYTRRIEIINENIQRFKDTSLKADVSFPAGTFRMSDLSEQGRTMCTNLSEKIVKTIGSIHGKYPGYPVRITLKTIGYTDEVPVSSLKLKKELESEISELSPFTDERRKQYHQVLSRFRAETINNYIVKIISQKIDPGIDIRLIQKVIGKGEKYPLKKAVPPYKTNDNRRRICIISPFIEILLKK